MKSLVIALSLLVGFVLPAVAQELLVNGDFEQDLSVGWKDTVYSEAGTWLFERSDTLGGWKSMPMTTGREGVAGQRSLPTTSHSSPPESKSTLRRRS